MSVRISILDGPLPAHTAGPIPGGAGAVTIFEGIVRRLEDGRELDALDYQAYEPMARDQLRRLCEDLIQRHGLLAIDVAHSRGRVAVGECSFRLVIHAPHRQEALAAMDEFINRLKRDVPIWKSPVWASDRLSARSGARPGP
jgi:molybdopterin synthase catalytic subunit